MITRSTISNFKRLETATLELGNAVVLVGPNNSGKTSALQAMTLWEVGWRRWTEKRDDSTASERKGATINRRDLYPIPIPSARLLWNDLHTQDTKTDDGKQRTEKVYIALTAEGVHEDRPWICSLEFCCANEESFYCRLKNTPDEESAGGGAPTLHRVSPALVGPGSKAQRTLPSCAVSPLVPTILRPRSFTVPCP